MTTHRVNDEGGMSWVHNSNEKGSRSGSLLCVVSSSTDFHSARADFGVCEWILDAKLRDLAVC